MRFRRLALTAASITAAFGTCLALYRWGGGNHDLTAVARQVHLNGELASHVEAVQRRNEAKRDVAAEVIAGRLTLREAASQFHRLNEADPPYPPGITSPPSDERILCGQVVNFAWSIFASQERFAEATRWHAKVFTDHPYLLDPRTDHRYFAASGAVRAGCGQGRDAADLDEKGRAGFRRQALDWLRADLKTRERLLETEAGKSRWFILVDLHHLLWNPAFEGVRGPGSLGQLPEAERRDWQQFWGEVEALRQHAIEW